jgi:hypothetical protein
LSKCDRAGWQKVKKRFEEMYCFCFRGGRSIITSFSKLEFLKPFRATDLLESLMKPAEIFSEEMYLNA